MKCAYAEFQKYCFFNNSEAKYSEFIELLNEEKYSSIEEKPLPLLEDSKLPPMEWLYSLFALDDFTPKKFLVISEEQDLPAITLGKKKEKAIVIFVPITCKEFTTHMQNFLQKTTKE